MTLDVQRLGLDDTPPRLIDYRWAWDEQRRIHAEVADGSRPGTVLLLEHADVYTVRGSWWATPSCGCPKASTSSTTCDGWKRC